MQNVEDGAGLEGDVIRGLSLVMLNPDVEMSM